MKRNNSDNTLRTVLHPLCMDGSHLFCARPLVTAAALVADAQSACCLAVSLSLLPSLSCATCSHLLLRFAVSFVISSCCVIVALTIKRADVVRNFGKKNSLREMQERAKANDIM